MARIDLPAVIRTNTDGVRITRYDLFYPGAHTSAETSTRL